MPTSSLRILIVDDGLNFADTMAGFLELAGHDAPTVYDGFGVLEAAARMLQM